ncbi:MAG: ATP-binding protein, partial [Pseudomonadota bacterium]
MEKPILADGSELSPVQSFLRGAEHLNGSIYVIDLIGFSKVTEAEIAESARSGTETVTRLITNLFGQLMDELAQRDIHFGGFAGDALIAWQADSNSVLSVAQLATISTNICQSIAPGITCRTATAQGTFWTADIATGQDLRPVTWGPAVLQAFSSLVSQPRGEISTSAIFESSPSWDEKIMVTASVSDRWTMIIRALTPEACGTATPDQLSSLLQRTVDICDAVGAEIDNIVQDDKGLLIVIILAASRAQDLTQRDRIRDNLTAVRNPIVHERDVASAFGTIFRCQPSLAGDPVSITLGEPINQSAKALDLEYASQTQPVQTLRTPLHATTQNLIGRERETQLLWHAYQASQHDRQTCILTAPAGVGKTVLVQDLSAKFEAPIAIVEATPGSRLLPFGCAQDLAEQCGLDAAAVFQSRGQIELARRIPNVIIIENWQWCDADSRRLIRRLQEKRTQGMLLVTSRSP